MAVGQDALHRALARPLAEPAAARGDRSRAAVLRALVVHGPSSRSDLARRAGVTRATIGTIVAGLVDDGLLVEVDESDERVSVLLGAAAAGCYADAADR